MSPHLPAPNLNRRRLNLALAAGAATLAAVRRLRTRRFIVRPFLAPLMAVEA